MRILYFGDGTSVHVRRWVSWFAARGHEVHLITKACEPIPGVPLTAIPLHEGAYRTRWGFRSAVKEVVRAFRPDVAHAHYLQAWGWYAFRADVRPLVVSAWGSDIAKDPDEHWYARRNARKIVRRADLIHVGDGPARDRVVSLGGDAARCFVQPWGIDIRQFSPDHRSEEWRRTVCPPGRTLILANRHLHEMFRHGVLLRAAAELRKTADGFAVAIVGGGPAQSALEKLATDSGLSGVVTFVGRVPPDDMPRYYASADVYVDCFPSQVGGHGASLSLVEAMSCGLPVVAARRPGLEEIVGSAGRLFPPDDPAALVSILREFVADPALVERMGALAVERARTVADRDTNLQKFEARMQELIATR